MNTNALVSTARALLGQYACL